MITAKSVHQHCLTATKVNKQPQRLSNPKQRVPLTDINLLYMDLSQQTMSQRQGSPKQSLLSAKLREAHRNDGNHDMALGLLNEVDGEQSSKTLTPSMSENKQQRAGATGALTMSKDYGVLATTPSGKLQRIYSENETKNFNSVDGRRMFDDDRYRPHRTRRNGERKDDEISSPSASVGRFKTRMHSGVGGSQSPGTRSFSHQVLRSDDTDSASTAAFKGMEDEYIPDFDFGAAVRFWNKEQSDTSLNSSFTPASATPGGSMGELHTQVKPVSVPHMDHHPKSEQDEEDFIASKLPRNFSDLPFSMRRKIITELSHSPLINREAIEKVVKKRFKKNKNESSPALQFLSSFSDRPKVNFEEPVLNHRLGRIIGSGAWGIIRECRDVKDDTERAMKIIRAKREDVKDVFRRETQMWSKLHHQFLLPLLNVKETDDTFFCLTKKACGGTLFDLVSKWGLYTTQSDEDLSRRIKITRKFGLEIIEALSYMHKMGIVHGDVKLENCLLDCYGEDAKIMVCDFGMSTQFKPPDVSEDITIQNNKRIKRRPSIPRSYSGAKLRRLHSLERIATDKNQTHDDTALQIDMTYSHASSESDMLSFDPSPITIKSPEVNPNLPDSHIGSLPYAAPELLESCPPPLGPSADIWAFGVLLYTMFVGKLPFQHQYEPRLRAMISAGRYDFESLVCATKSNEMLIDTVSGCMKRDLTERLTLDKAKELLERAKV